MNRFFNILFTLFVLGMVFFLGYEAKQTSNWTPVTGIVRANTSENRTIQYAVGKQLYSTDNENLLNLLEHRIHVKISHSRPGQNKTVINGVDPEIGRQVVVYYDPKDPSQAVVLRGWSAPVVLMLICSGIPLILSITLGPSWDQSRTNNRNSLW
ncbi:MAG: DUF3592 domain-containing protein [Cyanobacteria bacterium TGS_CYA1]|nr:DUF3592 domain-containing protein [Cyanobacteria bacterium TGS_CYA1]